MCKELPNYGIHFWRCLFRLNILHNALQLTALHCIKHILKPFAAGLSAWLHKE